jgi:hypothetical protein
VSEFAKYEPTEKCRTCGDGCCCRAKEFQYLLFHASQLKLENLPPAEIKQRLADFSGEAYEAYCGEMDLYEGKAPTTPVVGVPMVPDKEHDGYMCPDLTETGCSRSDEKKPAICWAVNTNTCQISDNDFHSIIDSWDNQTYATKAHLESLYK